MSRCEPVHANIVIVALSPIAEYLECRMSDVTQILQQIEAGDPSAVEELLPLVYAELRKLAAHRMAQEASGHTLEATGLVHEAYVRLVDKDKAQHWDSRAHFFAAAAEAMRRILVEQARRKRSQKRGGQWRRRDATLDEFCQPSTPDELLAIDEALEKLGRENPPIARLVELRYFAGLSQAEAAAALGVSTRTAQRYWVYAKAWLLEELGGGCP
jgi:RNA polymerase sigma factor (TIGR02999 family)